MDMNAASVFERARLQPNEPGLVDRSQTLSWSEVADRLVALSNALLELDIPHGSRLAVLGENSCGTMLMYAAAVLAGVGTILVNSHLTVDEVQYLLDDGAAHAIWSSPEFLATATEAAGPRRLLVLADVEDAGRWSFRVEQAQRRLPGGDLPTTTDLIYTSGTTGRAKAVEFPNELTPTVNDRLESMARHHMAGIGPHLVVGPLYHAGPHGAVGLLLTGSPIVVVGRFDAQFILDAIARFRIATSVMVPTHLIRLLGLPAHRREGAETSSLRLISVTGSACPIAVKQAMIDWFGPVFVETYGGSESGILTRITSEEWLAHKGSVGRTVPPFHPLVLDENGLPCPTGIDGVLYFVDDSGRGIRYHNDPDKTSAVHLVPGTFTLSDVGHVDAHGYLYITGRVSDMVISGGVNIYPAECERVLAEHPAVRDVALFGVPDEEMGERLVGVVSLEDDATEPRELVAFCRGSVAAYKVPRHLVVIPEVPRSPMGKVDKRSARDAYLEITRTPNHRSSQESNSITS
jgi:acyl-CoA synthetase (AMP-forming)/AMP-acid ligase II